MEAAELDVALEELETRLERLRALYEQYFMGLEKIEPAIARKDVDRRIYVLRREKIRNTAKRFKLQTIIQRYNTFQQYWQRICREIENGTYKRHLLRAQKQNPNQFLTIAARKRLGRQASQPPEASPSQPPAEAAPSSPPSVAPPASVPAPAPIAAAAVAPARPAGSPPIPPRRPPLPGRPAEASATTTNAAEPAPAAVAAPKPAAPPIAASAPKPAAPPAKFESLDLDMDFMGDWDPGARSAPAKPAPAKPAPQAAPPAARPPAPAPKPAPQAAPPKPAAPPLPAAAKAAVESVRPVAAPPRPMSSRPPTAPAVPRIPAAPRLPTAASPPIPARAAPAPKPAPAAAPIAPKPAAAAPKPAAPAPAPKPAAAAAPAPKPAATAGAAGVDDARLRDLHSRLQQAKQQTKEANVSFEGLAKSIRATEAKLREQHKNRKIEFDVVIKDGKAVVKPIVR